MEFQNSGSYASASSLDDSSFSTEEQPRPPLYRKRNARSAQKRKPEQTPFTIPRITNLAVTEPVQVSNSPTSSTKDSSISLKNTTLASGTRHIPSLRYTADLRPESKLLWAIASHQPIYILRSIGFHIIDLHLQRVFRQHPDPDLPTPLEACIIYNNLIALEYLVQDVAENFLSVPKDLSYEDRDKLVALAVECRRDEALLYLFQECAMWKYSTHACIFNLAETALVRSLEWRLQDLEKRNDLVGWTRHTSLLACLAKTVQADPLHQDDQVKGQARLEMVEMLLRVGGKSMLRGVEFLRILLQALEARRIGEAGVMFSAWRGYGPWSRLNRELVSQIFLAANERSETRWMAWALVADYPWLAPRLGLQVDEDGVVVAEHEVGTEPLTRTELEDEFGDADSAVADLMRELDLHIYDFK